MTLYSEALRDIIYNNKAKFQFLVATGLYDRYFDTIVLLQKLQDYYDNQQLEEMISRMQYIETIRAFIIDYVVTYLLYKNPDNKDLAVRTAEVINYQTGILINYIQSMIESTITKVRTVSGRVLLVARMLSYFGELITYFKEILLRDLDDIVPYILFKSQYIESLVETRSKIAEQIKDIEKTIEESAEESIKNVRISQEQGEEKKQQESIGNVLSNIASDLKLEYLRTSNEMKNILSKKIFNSTEIQVLSSLMQKGMYYPKASISLKDLAVSLDIEDKKVLRVINSILDKCKSINLPLFIRVDRINANGEEVEMVSIDPTLFKQAVDRLMKYHPELVDLFMQTYHGS